jgi:hypothetical protein
LPVSSSNNARQASRSAYWRGYLDYSPFILVTAPFEQLFGAVCAAMARRYLMQYLLP